ncbi:hypothetical protein C1645_835182 [Glomus cerebriforme]|uniref:Uncharacterized protein n=1 Tax=Glomus cerebriforme TaxID=658196 RepID=A0A397S8B0_9GLOM|nr:hypothetical protein C1645_835182 [Glomus cerebriforme]
MVKKTVKRRQVKQVKQATIRKQAKLAAIFLNIELNLSMRNTNNHSDPKPSASGSSGSSSLNTSGSNNKTSSILSSPPLAFNKWVQFTTNANMDEDFTSPPISGPIPQAETPLFPVATPFVPSTSTSPPSTFPVEMVDDSIYITSSVSKGKAKVADDEDVSPDATVQVSSSIFFAAAALNSFPFLLKKFKTNSALCVAVDHYAFKYTSFSKSAYCSSFANSKQIIVDFRSAEHKDQLIFFPIPDLENMLFHVPKSFTSQNPVISNFYSKYHPTQHRKLVFKVSPDKSFIDAAKSSSLGPTSSTGHTSPSAKNTK